MYFILFILCLPARNGELYSQILVSLNIGLLPMLKQYWKPVAGLLTTVLTIGSFNVLSAQANNGPVTFTLVNSTNRVLEAFYASPPSTDDWEEDILGRDVLAPGESVKITINDGRSDCLYDFKGVLGPGNGKGRGELVESQVQVCDGGTYEYFDK